MYEDYDLKGKEKEGKWKGKGGKRGRGNSLIVGCLISMWEVYCLKYNI